MLSENRFVQSFFGGKCIMIYKRLRHIFIDQKKVVDMIRDVVVLNSFRDKITIIVAAPLRPDRDKVSSSMNIIKCP